MSALNNLTKIFNTAKTIDIDDSSKIVLMSDCHRGDGSWGDNFSHNENIYYSALNYYYENGYTYIELGDGDELWENSDFSVIIEMHKDIFQLLKKFHEANRFYMIYGNHDMVKKRMKFIRRNLCCYFNTEDNEYKPLFKNITTYDALVLRYAKHKIFLLHGHQVDFLNSSVWKLARFLVRNLWRPLEAYGVNNPTSPAKNNKKKSSVEFVLSKWAQKEKHMLIAGHTHRPFFPALGRPLYFNDGSCVHPHCITAIEIANGSIALARWCIRSGDGGLLLVKRELLADPERLEDLFAAAG
ncbi:MAG TPA: metallophosphoesterase family protein [Clostridia bacterium]|nr:metallophosphoesterase family protein [Clostridia bacterium]